MTREKMESIANGLEHVGLGVSAAEVRDYLALTERLDGRRFPIIGDGSPAPVDVPWSVAERAYGAYAHKYGRRQSLEDLARRGGFHVGEMDALHPGWREETSEIARLRVEVENMRAQRDEERRLRIKEREGGS